MYCKHQQISHTCRQAQPRVCQPTFWRKILDRNQKKLQLELYESCIILVASVNIHLDKPSDNENRKYFDSSAITLVVNSRDIISTNLELCLILLKYCLIHKFFILVRFSLKFSHQTRNIQFVHLVLCCQVAWHLTKTQKFLIGSVNFGEFVAQFPEVHTDTSHC